MIFLCADCFILCLCVLHTHFYCSFCSYLEKLYLFVFVNIFCRNKRSCKCWMLSILSANEKRSTLVFVWMVVVVVISSFSSYLEGIPLCVSMFILHIYENILYSLQPHRFACMLPLHIYNKKLHLRSSSVSLSLYSNFFSSRTVYAFEWGWRFHFHFRIQHTCHIRKIAIANYSGCCRYAYELSIV